MLSTNCLQVQITFCQGRQHFYVTKQEPGSFGA